MTPFRFYVIQQKILLFRCYIKKEGGEVAKQRRKEVKRKGRDGIRKLVLFGVGRTQCVQSFPSLN